MKVYVSYFSWIMLGLGVLRELSKKGGDWNPETALWVEWRFALILNV